MRHARFRRCRAQKRKQMATIERLLRRAHADLLHAPSSTAWSSYFRSIASARPKRVSRRSSFRPRNTTASHLQHDDTTEHAGEGEGPDGERTPDPGSRSSSPSSASTRVRPANAFTGGASRRCNRIDLTANVQKQAGHALYLSLGFRERDTNSLRLDLCPRRAKQPIADLRMASVHVRPQTPGGPVVRARGCGALSIASGRSTSELFGVIRPTPR